MFIVKNEYSFLDDISKIKLIIWDLDETFWHGTLSEEGITEIPENLELVKTLTGKGIINSICSKNDEQPVLEELSRLGVLDYFVFISADWNSKGGRIKQIIEDMQLRPKNVLFLDDNHLNLEEAKYFCPDIMTAMPDILPGLISAANTYEKDDKEHKRLNQYKILENKKSERNKVSSNDEFLRDSRIKVEIFEDCLDEETRIHDLLLRANQLNFTKNRASIKELHATLTDGHSCGYVTVRDRFGDYGIAGFYALDTVRNTLVHFAFSCRALGMGIEQYVYAHLGFPDISVIGEVVTELKNDVCPDWINIDSESEKAVENVQNSTDFRMLLKGPCDLFQIKDCLLKTDAIDAELTHINKDTGVNIGVHNHVLHILQSLTLTEEQKRQVINENPFTDETFYATNMFSGNYDAVCLSILLNANHGVYRRRETGQLLAIGEHVFPLTHEKYHEGYITGKIYNENCKFTKNFLVSFSEKYEFMGRVEARQLYESLEYIRKKLPQHTLLILGLGTELPYLKNKNPAYENRHETHKEYNEVLKKLCSVYPNVKLIDPNVYVTEQSHYADMINHYSRVIYYKLAQDIIKITGEHFENNFETVGKISLARQVAMSKIKGAVRRVLNIIKGR